jgi:cytochrome oxidase Cu insertion factor (SCO1/SenC/PrrC family)
VLRWALLAAVALAAVAAVSLTMVLRTDAKPTVEQFLTWQAGEKQAPQIRLRTAEGAPFRLASLRGRVSIVTFVDPHCTTFCPRESLVIDDAVRALPVAQRPSIVAVSVDPTVTSPRVFRQEAKRLRWLPQWRWATGSHAALARVWRSYHVEVIPTKADITHTELAYVVDANGDERALLLWPFHADDVLRALASASS